MKKYLFTIILIFFCFKTYAEDQRKVVFKTNVCSFNNSDFLEYNEDRYKKYKSSDRENSDDRVSFVYSDLSFLLKKDLKTSFFNLDISKRMFWGGDNFSRTGEGASAISVNELYFDYKPDEIISLGLGRRPFEIGGSISDYFFSETVDSVQTSFSFDLSGRKFGLLLKCDMLGNSALPKDSYAWSETPKDEETMENFDGDTLSLRYGLIADYYCVKVFGFFVRYGASSKGGSDLSDNGKNNLNMPDGDFLTTDGIRFYVPDELSEKVKVDLTYSFCYGKNYQRGYIKKYNGNATALNIALPISKLTENSVSWFEKLFFSVGYFGKEYCGMGSVSPGGFLTGSYLGYSVSPYVNHYNITDYSRNNKEVSLIDKTVSKSFIRPSVVFNFMKILVSVNTSFLFANETEKMIISNKPGKTKKGNGRINYMGNEIDLNCSYKTENLKIYSIFGIYFPSDYYKKRSKYNSFIQKGRRSFYGFLLGFDYFFDI